MGKKRGKSSRRKRAVQNTSSLALFYSLTIYLSSILYILNVLLFPALPQDDAVPKTLIINRTSLGITGNNLMLDFRRVMEPFTTTKLKVFFSSSTCTLKIHIIFLNQHIYWRLPLISDYYFRHEERMCSKTLWTLLVRLVSHILGFSLAQSKALTWYLLWSDFT